MIHFRIGLLAALGVALATFLFTPAMADTYDLKIGETTVNVSGEPTTALTVNGQMPAPTLRFKEGETVVINVTNTLDRDTSLHWHGMILPYTQDGVPGISFPGIKPGETFTYTFKIKQSGTYWYHSHSGMQEQEGLYGAIVIDPAKRDPFSYDREYLVVLSDWHDSKPERILSNLKRRSDYYNYSRRTVGTFFDDIASKGFDAALRDRLDWGEMRMEPTDIADVTGYTFLVNGKNPEQNWTGIFKAGERVRLRFVNASAMTYFDIRIPGLSMTVVQSDGNNVQPVVVDEARIAVAETYDVIVQPTENKPFTIFAESMDRAGFARATMAPTAGLKGAIPATRERPLLTMSDMGEGHAGMDHSAMPGMSQPAMPGMDHSKMMTGPKPDPFYSTGSGLAPVPAEKGQKVLSYKDLKAQKPLYRKRPATRDIELRLTGNMERYFWSINGRKYSEAEPIRLTLGERVRFKFTNETMMAHPMHLHGMWMILDNGSGRFNPAKHVVSVAPGSTLIAEVEADAEGQWAFHCHLLYHMQAGMFRKVIVERPAQTTLLIDRETVQ
jgi:CopA family copper-resistance protein